MIFPTKRLSVGRSLLFVGAEILEILDKPKTINQLWSIYRSKFDIKDGKRIITFEWFSLGIDFLFIINLIGLKNSKLIKKDINA